MIVEYTTDSQIKKLLPLAREFFKKSGFEGVWSDQQFVASLLGFVEKGIGVVFVAERDGKPVAMLGGLVSPDLYTEDVVAVETFWYAGKKSVPGEGRKLLEKYEDWSRVKGAKRLRMGSLLNARTPALTRVYRRRGYFPLEAVYEKNL